jgi:hypothetical protein
MFLDDVASSLTPGKAAVLAEVDETWTTPIDTRLREFGGMVFRRLRSEVIEDQLARESAAYEASLKALNDELRKAIAENKAAIQKEIEQTKKHLRAIQDNAQQRLDQAKNEMEVRMKALQEQAISASDRAKARIEKRRAALKADYEVRSGKLKQAWTLTKEALAA